MKKKFLFVNFSISTWGGANHGIAFLTPILKDYSYAVSCLGVHKEISGEEFEKKINEFDPSILGFSATSHQLKYLIKYSKEVKKHTKILQIAGGVGPSLDPENVLVRSAVHGVCIGEGETPLRNLLNNIEKGDPVHHTEGFYWHFNGVIRKNPVPQFVSNLSSIAFPDYSIFKKKTVYNERNKNLSIILGRGCPCNCSFCCNETLSGLYPSSSGYFRMPSVDWSIALIKKMIENYPGVKFIDFKDDNMIANKKWFMEFAEKYSKEVDIPYSMCGRVEWITAETLELLSQSKCSRLNIGLESGNENLRKNFLNRPYSNKLFIEKCGMIKAAGLGLHTLNIVGFPFEDRKVRMDTFKLNKKVKPDRGTCSFFRPYKGSSLYNLCIQNNLLKTEEEMMELTNYNDRPFIKMSASQERECIRFNRRLGLFFSMRSELSKGSAIHPYPKRVIYFLFTRFKWALRKNPLFYNAIKRFCKLFPFKFGFK